MNKVRFWKSFRRSQQGLIMEKLKTSIFVTRGFIHNAFTLFLRLWLYMLIALANSLYPNQVQPNVRPDLDPNCLTR